VASIAVALLAAVALTACGNTPYAARTAALSTTSPSALPVSPSGSPSGVASDVSTASPSLAASTPAAVPVPDPSPCEALAASEAARAKGATPPAVPERKREMVPIDFRPVLFVTCTTELRPTPTDGEWAYIVEKQATDGLDAVVEALRATPPPAPSGDRVCTTEFRGDPWFLLIDASGREILPVVPHDNSCNKAIDVGITHLQLTSTRAFPVRQQRTQAELTTSCERAWKNEPKISVSMHGVRDSATALALPGQPTSVCVYGPGTDPEVGEFAGGRKLNAAEADLLRQLAKAPAGQSGSCQPSERFALILMGDAYEYVELSGCHRLVASGGSLYGGPVPALVDAIGQLDLAK
jgi:hypothetical protein